MRPVSSLCLAGLALAVTGCLNGPVTAPAGSSISVSPTEMNITGSSTFCFADNDGILLSFDAFVVDSLGNALPNVQVEVFSLLPGGVYILPTTAIRTVDYPTAPADFEAQKADVCTDENGQYNPDGASWCAWYYDRTTGTFYDFGGSYSDASGQSDTASYRFAPAYLLSKTDRVGRLRVYYFIDAMPFKADGESADTATIAAGGAACAGVGGDFGNTGLYATIGVDIAEVSLTGSGT